MRSLSSPAVQTALAARLGDVTPETTRRWGTMTPHEMLCHVADAFEVALGDRPPSAMATKGPAGLIRRIVLWVPVPWPKNVPTGANVNPRKAGTKPSDFGADRDRAIRLLQRLAAEARSAPHPFFGMMSARDWLRWGFLHTDHHLRQFGR